MHGDAAVSGGGVCAQVRCEQVGGARRRKKHTVEHGAKEKNQWSTAQKNHGGARRKHTPTQGSRRQKKPVQQKGSWQRTDGQQLYKAAMQFTKDMEEEDWSESEEDSEGSEGEEEEPQPKKKKGPVVGQYYLKDNVSRNPYHYFHVVLKHGKKAQRPQRINKNDPSKLGMLPDDAAAQFESGTLEWIPVRMTAA